MQNVDAAAAAATGTCGNQTNSPIVEPFTRREEGEMHKFAFTPVDTICGRLCMSVLYRSLSESDVSCSQHSAPLSPTFITDYVGSPLADPLKSFPSLPLSYGSPPLMSFERRHSWSFDRCKASSPPPSVSCSPSPTRSDPQAIVLILVLVAFLLILVI